MNDLIIEASETSPRVYFSAPNNCFEITGNSRPYNPGKFYEPIIQWLDDFGKDSSQIAELKLKMHLEYFNSSSTKYLLQVLMKFAEIKSLKNIPVSIDWHYDEDDFELKETGKEFERLLKIPFNYIAEAE